MRHIQAAPCAGGFVISLDFELMWGLKGAGDPAACAARAMGARRAIPRLLDLFGRRGLGCTWATVGLLFFENREELMASLPRRIPRYRDPKLSTLDHVGDAGPDERRDPVHYAPSLLREIASRPRQVVGCHTFSHIYALEEGVEAEDFRADLDAALAAAARRGLRPRSLVFPRNQVNPAYLPDLRARGFEVYRSCASGFFDAPMTRERETRWIRGMRLADSYVRLSPSSRAIWRDGLAEVPASLFFRPHDPGARLAGRARLARILRAMRAAARKGDLFHIWFHPHNIGAAVEENLGVLEIIAAEAARLRDEWGWPTLNMEEAAAAARGTPETGAAAA